MSKTAQPGEGIPGIIDLSARGALRPQDSLAVFRTSAIGTPAIGTPTFPTRGESVSSESVASDMRIEPDEP